MDRVAAARRELAPAAASTAHGRLAPPAAGQAQAASRQRDSAAARCSSRRPSTARCRRRRLCTATACRLQTAPLLAAASRAVAPTCVSVHRCKLTALSDVHRQQPRAALQIRHPAVLSLSTSPDLAPAGTLLAAATSSSSRSVRVLPAGCLCEAVTALAQAAAARAVPGGPAAVAPGSSARAHVAWHMRLTRNLTSGRCKPASCHAVKACCKSLEIFSPGC